MTSNGEKQMMKRSDFAQKLLDDLRVRKQHLSSSHKSLQSDNSAYSKIGFKGSRAKSTSFQDFNYGGAKILTSDSIEASNQIVPYGKGRNMEKIDLSKALALALENAGKATRADPSGNASIISFLHEVGKRSVGERRSIHVVQQQKPSSSSPMIHVHMKEISKGAHKLNQIIKACSNGLSFRKGKYSIQCGEQLMQGAIELEQSLRLLVDIQQASEYTTNKQSRNRIKLLDEHDEDEDEDEEDAHNKNHQKITQVAKADIEMRVLSLNYQRDKSNKHRKTSSCGEIEARSLKPQKGRIPSVVAKLMGLGDFPEDKNETTSSTKEVSELIVELKAERKLRSMDLAVHKETQTANEINNKTKFQKNDGEQDDSNISKRHRVSYKKDCETKTRKDSSLVEDHHKVVKRSQLKPSHKLFFESKQISHHLSEEEKSIKKDNLQREKQQEKGVASYHSPKHMRSGDIQTKTSLTGKAKAVRRSLSHVEVARKGKEGEVHIAKIRKKKNQDIYSPDEALCKVMKRQEIKRPDEKNDLLHKSNNESVNKIKAEEEKCIKRSEALGVEHREIKDDSILLIAAERVPCQDPSANHNRGLIFTDGVDQQAPRLKSNGNSDWLSKPICKGTKEEGENGVPLLEKRQEHQIRETTAETLSEKERNLKKILVKSQLFQDTAKALFKLNIPSNVFHDAIDYYEEDKNLILDCGFELMKRKRRFQELSVHPFMNVPISFSKVNSLDNLIRLISEEIEKLRAYRRDGHTGSHVEESVIERDVHHKDPNLNSMWDMGWNDSMLAFIEKDDVLRDIEREVFSGLLDEITRDLICI